MQKRPIQYLPVPFPKDYDPGPKFFHDNFASSFIEDMVRMMDTGLLIDSDAVNDLRKLINKVQKSVRERLDKNPMVIEYQENVQRPAKQKDHEEKATQSLRTVDYYIKPYKPGDMLHRTWVVNTYLMMEGQEHLVKDKWTVKDVKDHLVFNPSNFLQGVIEKLPYKNSEIVNAAMLKLAEYKLELWNRPRFEKANEKVALQPFNPNSTKQTTEFFDYFDVPPLAFSKDTGEASWGRDQIEQTKKEYEQYDNTENLMDFLDALIDNSYSAIIKNNFIKAFDTYSVDGVLHGNIKLFGAKSFRNTSNSPNLLNAPSTKSIYAKPLKRCFRAKDGFVIYAIDLSALEDRVISNLSGDVNKCSVFTEGLDGHSVNACGYYTKQIEDIIGPKKDDVSFVKKFMEVHGQGNKILEKLRQISKGPTFKLAYGGFPDSHKGGVITPALFDRYHNVLYPGITDYRENYVLPTALRKGYLHLGLGCRIYSDNPDNDIRTLHNATVQFWSILTLIAVNEINYRIDQEGLSDWIQVQSTIYDSIYTQCYKDPELIKWLNDNLVDVMTVQYLEDEIVHNEATGEIGYNWADLHKVPNGASVPDIEKVLEDL